MNIYFLISFFLPRVERPTRPDPSKIMAAGSGKFIITPSMSMRLARAFPPIKNKTQITKKNSVINLFINILSFPAELDSWILLKIICQNLTLKFDRSYEQVMCQMGRGSDKIKWVLLMLNYQIVMAQPGF